MELTFERRQLQTPQLDIILRQLNINLPVVFCECETWSLTLREEQRLGLCENRVLRRINGPKAGRGTGFRQQLQKEELHNLYSSANRI
jgi:hypothetical protein